MGAFLGPSTAGTGCWLGLLGGGDRTVPWPGPDWSLEQEAAGSQGDLSCGLVLAVKGICIRKWVK